MNRANVIIVIFDLCTKTPADRRNYRTFHKFLVNSGYSSIQESVYAKLLKNSSGCNGEMQDISKYAPDDGNVIAFQMTLNEFKSIKFIRGHEFNFATFSDSIVVL